MRSNSAPPGAMITHCVEGSPTRRASVCTGLRLATREGRFRCLMLSHMLRIDHKKSTGFVHACVLTCEVIVTILTHDFEEF